MKEEVKAPVNVNKSELVAAVAEKAGLTKKAAEQAVNAVFAVVKDALAAKKKVQMIGFGTFEVHHRQARKGRNPRTGEEIKIAASSSPVFKPGKALKEAVNPPKPVAKPAEKPKGKKGKK